MTKSKSKPVGNNAPGARGKSPMARIDSELVRQLASVLDETGLTEIEYESGGLRLRVARTAGGGVSTAALAAPAPVETTASKEAAAMPTDPAAHPGAVKAPMVGVVYLLPEPGAPAFVKVGDQVATGQTIALIEAMKTFNPVKAPRSGKVTSIIVENGAPVEFGEPLVVIE